MNTSTYLRTQADLLNIRRMVRSLPLEEFRNKLEEVIRAGYLVDAQGRDVVTDPVLMKRLVIAVEQLQEITIEGELPMRKQAGRAIPPEVTTTNTNTNNLKNNLKTGAA
jgi:hypothetical protein